MTVRVCATCGLVLKPERNGVLAVLMEGDHALSAYLSDLYCCPGCRHQVILDGGHSPVYRVNTHDMEAAIGNYQRNGGQIHRFWPNIQSKGAS